MFIKVSLSRQGAVYRTDSAIKICSNVSVVPKNKYLDLFKFLETDSIFRATHGINSNYIILKLRLWYSQVARYWN